MRSHLSAERDRLSALAASLHRECAVGRDNLGREMPAILKFCGQYQSDFMRYLEAVLPQHEHGIRCGAGCGSCCRHYPMSVEPFELMYLYSSLRCGDGLLEILEACHSRAELFLALMTAAAEKGGEDPEENALQAYFMRSRSCPFLVGKTGDCGVYAHRPVTCRMYFSETAPEFCTPEFLLTEKNRSFIVYLPDDIEELIAEVSAHYRPLELPEALYGGLLALNALEPCFAERAG